MAENLAEDASGHRRRRRTRKRTNHKRKKLMQNLRWLIGGFLIGLPFLVLLIYLASYMLDWYF